ncbi:MAG: MGMT family protein [Pseudomonadales bacterium]|jgi:methylated-DNA-protein-cysteine methyltransferase-like protein|nr:MGMT family protein [Pseudomonadales bacterium]
MEDSALNNKEKIWQIVYQIPRGKVSSYGQVARLAGLPGYARYVGNVMKNLPKDTKLPWHRVANSQGKLSFHQESREYQTQKTRLEAEGVVFVNGRFSLKKFGWDQDAVRASCSIR